jgi:hypothetical protein
MRTISAVPACPAMVSTTEDARDWCRRHFCGRRGRRIRCPRGAQPEEAGSSASSSTSAGTDGGSARRGPGWAAESLSAAGSDPERALIAWQTVWTGLNQLPPAARRHRDMSSTGCR